VHSEGYSGLWRHEAIGTSARGVYCKSQSVVAFEGGGGDWKRPLAGLSESKRGDFAVFTGRTQTDKKKIPKAKKTVEISRQIWYIIIDGLGRF